VIEVLLAYAKIKGQEKWIWKLRLANIFGSTTTKFMSRQILIFFTLRSLKSNCFHTVDQLYVILLPKSKKDNLIISKQINLQQ